MYHQVRVDRQVLKIDLILYQYQVLTIFVQVNQILTIIFSFIIVLVACSSLLLLFLTILYNLRFFRIVLFVSVFLFLFFSKVAIIFRRIMIYLIFGWVARNIMILLQITLTKIYLHEFLLSLTFYFLSFPEVPSVLLIDYAQNI